MDTNKAPNELVEQVAAVIERHAPFWSLATWELEAIARDLIEVLRKDAERRVVG